MLQPLSVSAVWNKDDETETPPSSDVDIPVAENQVVGSNSTTDTALIIPAAEFKVAVPLQLPVTVASDGTVITGEAYITNYSEGMVQVSDIKINPKDDWSLVDFNKDFKSIPVNSQYLGFKLNGIETTDEGFTFDSAAFPALEAASNKGGGINISSYNRQQLKYDARIPTQAITMNNKVIADVVITVDWATADSGKVEKAAGIYNDEGVMTASWKELVDSGDILVKGTAIEYHNTESTALNGDLVIDDSITEIESGAFYHCDTITSVVIPESVTNIGDNAFAGCTKLASVSLPNTISAINKYTFSGTALTSIEIPNSVTTIGQQAFEGTLLTDVTLPSSVTNIDSYAFLQCNKLKTVTLPDSITEMDIAVFAESKNLETVKLPSKLTAIPDYTFSKCDSLKTVVIPDSVTTIGKQAFEDCTSLTTIQLPQNLTTIKDFAFSGCTNLGLVRIPSSVTTIGEDAFEKVPEILISSNIAGSPWGALKMSCSNPSFCMGSAV